MGKVKLRKDFQQARWNEPIIYEMSTPGVRGILIPEAEEEIKSQAGGRLETTTGQYAQEIPPGQPAGIIPETCTNALPAPGSGNHGSKSRQRSQ